MKEKYLEYGVALYFGDGEDPTELMLEDVSRLGLI